MAREESNLPAIQFLSAQRVVNDVRYYGVSGYWNKVMAKSIASTTITEPVRSSSTSTVAKVPFVITQGQRTALAELGFELVDVKKLTPVKAVVILEHSLTPDDCNGDNSLLDAKLQEREETERIERAKMEEEIRVVEAASGPSKPTIPQSEPPPPPQSETPTPLQAQFPAIIEDTVERTFVGVFDGKQRIALYDSIEEAQMFIQHKIKGGGNTQYRIEEDCK